MQRSITSIHSRDARSVSRPSLSVGEISRSGDFKIRKKPSRSVLVPSAKNEGSAKPSASPDNSPDKEPLTQKKKKVEPACCTVPIAALFIVACVAIAGVFTAIAVQSSLAFQAEVESGVRNSISPALENAMSVFVAPLIQTATWARTMKMRLESSPAKYGCDDSIVNMGFPGNDTNYGFFYEAGMHSLARPTLQFIYLTRVSKRYFNADGTGRSLVCLLSPGAKEAGLFYNNSRMSINFGAGGSALENMRTVHMAASQNVDISHLPLSIDPMNTVGSRWLSASILITMDENITLLNASLGGIQTKFCFLIQIVDPYDPTAKWGLGIDHNMKDLRQTLSQATPPISVSAEGSNASAESLYVTPGAHTTLYDMANLMIMSSTREDSPAVQLTGKLYRAGSSPVKDINDAYQTALSKCAEEDCTKVTITLGKDTVHTAYAIKRPEYNLDLLVVQVVPRAYFFASTDRTFAITLGLSIGSCVFVVVGCVFLLILIQRPLASLMTNMMEAAELHNDRVEHTATYLRDISQLSFVFDSMNQQLLIARSFVPEAVLLGKSVDSDDDDGKDEEGSFTGADNSMNTVHTTNTGMKDHTMAQSTINLTNNSSDSSNGGMGKLFNIAEKRAGVLSLNLVGFHALCAPEKNASRVYKINELSTALLSLAVSCAHGERGVMDSFHGDHFVLTFNASRAVAGPLAAAVRTAGAFIDEVRNQSQFDGCGGVGAGAAVGRSHVGTFGIDGYRRMSVVGEAYRTATALQQASVQLLRLNQGRVAEGCLVEESSLKELSNCAVHLQLVTCLQSSAYRASQANDKSGPTNAYYAHVVDSNNAEMEAMKADGEWLYELDAFEALDPYVDANRAMKALFEGNVKLCTEMVESYAIGLSNRRRASASGSPTELPSMGAFSFSSKDGGVAGASGDLLADVNPAWSFVRDQLASFTREMRGVEDVDRVTTLLRHLGVSWLTFQQ